MIVVFRIVLLEKDLLGVPIRGIVAECWLDVARDLLGEAESECRFSFRPGCRLGRRLVLLTIC